MKFQQSSYAFLRYFRCLRASEESLCFRDISLEFEHVGRVSATDGDGAYALAERAVAVDSYLPRLLFILRTICHIHAAGTARQTSISGESLVVTRVKHTSLALKGNASMRTLRRAAKIVTIRKLRVCRNELPNVGHRLEGFPTA